MLSIVFHALKVLHTCDLTLCERLLAEGRIQATLSHNNLVQVYDSFMLPTGQLALVMDLVDGLPLDRLLRQGRLRQAEDSLRDAERRVADVARERDRVGQLHANASRELADLMQSQGRRDGRMEGLRSELEEAASKASALASALDEARIGQAAAEEARDAAVARASRAQAAGDAMREECDRLALAASNGEAARRRLEAWWSQLGCGAWPHCLLELHPVCYMRELEL